MVRWRADAGIGGTVGRVGSARVLPDLEGENHQRQGAMNHLYHSKQTISSRGELFELVLHDPFSDQVLPLDLELLVERP